MRVRPLASCGCGRSGRRLYSRWADQIYVVHILHPLSCLGCKRLSQQTQLPMTIMLSMHASAHQQSMHSVPSYMKVSMCIM